jgi:homopolymeric O-antigen transport system permease protein
MASTVPELAYDSDVIFEKSPPGDPACSGYAYELPDQPLISIRPSRTWVALNLRDLWAYRELLFFLTWRDVQVRYKQTVLGVAWAIIQPLATMLIFTLFFGKLAGMPSEDIPYPLFAYAGLLPWTFFSNAVTSSGNSLVGSSNLITKVYFPRMIIPGAAVGAGLVDFAIAFALLAGLMAYYHVVVTWSILMLPVLVALTTLLALGVGMWMSALNVKYRDIRYALPFLIQLWMFASPIIYPASIVPERWRWVLALNPLTGIIVGIRSALFGRPFDWTALSMAAILTVAILTYAAYDFRRMEKTFADVV